MKVDLTKILPVFQTTAKDQFDLHLFHFQSSIRRLTYHFMLSIVFFDFFSKGFILKAITNDNGAPKKRANKCII